MQKYRSTTVSIIKRAFIQGLQRSLVTAGAIPPYSSIYQQKHALDQAEEKLEEKEEMEGEEKDPQEMSEEDVSDIMTDIVEAEPLSEGVEEAIKALEQQKEVSGDSEEASEELIEALKKLDDSKEAALAIRRLKMAGSPVGSGPIGNEMITAPGNLESGHGAAPQMPAGLRVDQLEPHAHVGPNNGDSASTLGSVVKDKTSKSAPSSQEVKAAMAILRKLAGEDPSSPEAMNAGAEDHEQDMRPTMIPNNVKNVAPVPPTTDILDAHSAAIPAAGDGKEVLAALVAKTASEVGHFLPQELSASDKLAALRTMVGMNGQERAAYIGRIKQAMHNDYAGAGLTEEDRAAQVLRNFGM
jgi:hypothetical protein